MFPKQYNRIWNKSFKKMSSNWHVTEISSDKWSWRLYIYRQPTTLLTSSVTLTLKRCSWDNLPVLTETISLWFAPERKKFVELSPCKLLASSGLIYYRVTWWEPANGESGYNYWATGHTRSRSLISTLHQALQSLVNLGKTCYILAM